MAIQGRTHGMDKGEIDNALGMIQGNRAFMQESGAPEVDFRELDKEEKRLTDQREKLEEKENK